MHYMVRIELTNGDSGKILRTICEADSVAKAMEGAIEAQANNPDSLDWESSGQATDELNGDAFKAYPPVEIDQEDLATVLKYF